LEILDIDTLVKKLTDKIMSSLNMWKKTYKINIKNKYFAHLNFIGLALFGQLTVLLFINLEDESSFTKHNYIDQRKRRLLSIWGYTKLA
jgi:hypothetical protein